MPRWTAFRVLAGLALPWTAAWAIACSRGSPPPERPDAGRGPGTWSDAEELEHIKTSTHPVALVNGLPIDKAAFLVEYARTLDRYASAKHAVTPAERAGLKETLIAELVEAEIFRQHAEELGVTVEAAELEAKWAEERGNLGPPEAFAKHLEQSRLTEADAKARLARTLLREKLYAALAARVVVTDEELKAAFEASRDLREQPEQVRSSHIFFRAPRDTKPEEKAKKLALAKEAAARARAGDFAAVAKKYSEDPSRDAGGDLGWRTRGQLLKPYEDAVWKMNIGEVAGPIETALGLHVIQKTGHKPARISSLEEVKPALEARLASDKKAAAVQSTIQGWKAAARVHVFEDGRAKVSAVRR